MTIPLFLPRDVGALAVGADDVATTLIAAARRRGVPVALTRTGSRGLYWLEPMLEVATPLGRVAYGPLTVADVDSVLDAILRDGPHARRIGLTEEIPFLKRQTRLTFARCGIIDPLSIAD